MTMKAPGWSEHAREIRLHSVALSRTLQLDARINPVKVVGLMIHCAGHELEAGLWSNGRYLGFRSMHPERLSKTGDPLEGSGGDG